MKKFLVVPLALCALGLAACGTQTVVKTVPAKPTAAQVAAQVAAQAAAKQAAAKAKAAAAVAKAKKNIAKIEREIQQTEAKTSLQSLVQKDAREKVAEGYLDGPIKHVSCEPATSADSATTEETFNCLAVDKTNADGTEEGYSYVGTANFNTGMVTAHLGNS